jgi:predicted GTPase
VGHEGSYYPGEVNVRMADVVIINKEDSAKKEDIERLRASIKELNPSARIIDADSPITVEHPEIIKGKRVLAVEDGPTLTHGEMTYGAGVLAAKANGAKELVDPRKWAAGEIRKTFEKYPRIGVLLPAMGYGQKQVADLEATINACDCDSVVIGTPINLGRLIKINKPSTRVEYNLAEKGGLTLAKVLDEFLAKA